MELTLKEAISTVEAYGLLDVDIPKPYKRAIQVLYDHAKKSMEPLEGEAFVGREVQCLGQYFTIIKYSTINNDYLIDNGRLRLWVNREKFRVIE